MLIGLISHVVVDMIAHGVMFIMMGILIYLNYRRNRRIAELETSVKIKKLQVSERILDDQLTGGGPDIMEMLQQNAQQQQMEQQQQQSKEQEDRTPVGFKR